MKNRLAKLLAILLIGTIAACSSEEDGIDQNIFGTWTFTTTIFRDCADSDLNDVISETCTDSSCKKLEINSDNSYRFITQIGTTESIQSGTFEIRGGQIQLTPTSGNANVFDFVVTSVSLILSSDLLACKQDLVYSK